MHKIMELRDNLMEQLEMFADHKITEQNIVYIDTLAHAIKCIDTVVAMDIEEEYGGESRDEYSGRRYRDNNSRRGNSRDMREGGMSNRRRRTSMDDGYSNRRGYSRDEAKDKLIDQMEGMMGDVSPEAQHAIQKAIHALGQE